MSGARGAGGALARGARCAATRGDARMTMPAAARNPAGSAARILSDR
jgi:hypothetical protein